MTSKRLLEMIDACQPDSDDLSQSELSELSDALSRDPQLQHVFEQSQELDLSLRSSFQAVTPPAGLVDRLLAAVEDDAIGNEVVDTQLDSDEHRVELPERPSRRALTIWAGVASLSAVVVVAAMWLQTPSTEWTLTEPTIAARVGQWNNALEEDNWQPVSDGAVAEFPTWAHLKLSRHDRWQWTKVGEIVCYDLATGEGEARLFVMKPLPGMALPKTPPVGYLSPEGWHVGGWQANGRVYFLAVRADRNSKRLYSQIIAPPPHA